MKNMKWILLIVLCLAVLISCGKQEAAVEEPVPEAVIEPAPETAAEPAPEPVEEHAHEAEGWDRDWKEHWQVCSCGETFGSEVHVLEDEVTCSVCGSEIWAYDDGTTCVYDHNADGECIRFTEYGTDGSVTFDEVTEVTCDADGNRAYAAVYQMGVLVSETEYEGGILKKHTYYYDDGTWGYSVYENDYEAYSVNFTADDAIDVEQFYEYGQAADGRVYESKKTVKFAGSETHVTERNEYGDVTSWIVYDADGTVTDSMFHEFRYDDRGNLLWDKAEYTGERVDETTYTYNEDGIRLLEETVSTDGSRYTMEYRVMDGWSYGALQTEVLPDGTTVIMEFDEFGDTVMEKHLRADGTEIPEAEW